MALQNLPNELLFLIASHLKTEADISSLSQVSHGVHTTTDPYLYEQNVDNSKGSALIYAACTGHLSTAYKALQAGAEFNDKSYAFWDACAISEAARNGSVEVLKLLLEHELQRHRISHYLPSSTIFGMDTTAFGRYEWECRGCSRLGGRGHGS